MKHKSIVLLFTFLIVAGAFFLSGCDIGSSGGSGGSSGGVQGEGGGFVWKPVSESDRKLVVLLPPQYRGRAAGAFILDSRGSILDRGNFAGDSHNGNRPHYRFPKSGGAYGDNLKLVADLNDGGSVHWNIPRGSVRTVY